MPRGGVLPGGLRPGEGRQPFCPSEACSTTNAARDEYGGVLLGGVLLERAGALEDSQDEYSWDEYRSEAYWLGGMVSRRHALWAAWSLGGVLRGPTHSLGGVLPGRALPGGVLPGRVLPG